MLALLTKHTPTHLEDRLKAFAASFGVLTEPLNTCFLDLIFDLLPPAAECCYLGLLAEVRRRS